MKKILALSLSLLLATMSCKSPVIELEAQTLPYNLKAGWDNNPATDNVLNYSVYVDGQKAVTVDNATACTPAGCSTIVPIQTAGQHTIAILATNQYGDGPIAGCTSCAFTINLTVPTAVKNVRIVP